MTVFARLALLEASLRSRAPAAETAATFARALLPSFRLSRALPTPHEAQLKSRLHSKVMELGEQIEGGIQISIRVQRGDRRSATSMDVAFGTLGKRGSFIHSLNEAIEKLDGLASTTTYASSSF